MSLIGLGSLQQCLDHTSSQNAAIAKSKVVEHHRKRREIGEKNILALIDRMDNVTKAISEMHKSMNKRRR